MITTGYFQLFIFQYYRLTSKSDIYPRLHSLQSGNLLPSWNVSYKAPVLFMFGNLQLPLQYGIVKFQPRVYQDTSLDLELAQIKNLLEYRFHQSLHNFGNKSKRPLRKTTFLKDYVVSPSQSHPGCGNIICINNGLMMLALPRNEPPNNLSKR